jgi:hypothetical protein
MGAVSGADAHTLLSTIPCAPGVVVPYYSLDGGVSDPVQVEGHTVRHDHGHRKVAQPPASVGASSAHVTSFHVHRGGGGWESMCIQYA